MIELTHISLFAGIAGIDLAAEWAGFKTILFVEIDEYCQKVLKKHWPDVPIIGDIKNVKGTEYTATLITGGFPCQPVSQAGQRRGKEDDRWLWPDMLRVISEVRPAWVVAENVTGLLTMGFYDCLSDLEGAGYETIPFVIPACGVNAPHRRDRIFIVAHYEGSRLGPKLSKFTGKLLPEDRTPQELESGSGDGANTDNSSTARQREHSRKGLCVSESGQPSKGSNISDSIGTRLEKRKGISRDAGKECQATERNSISNGAIQWATEPELGRVAYGIPCRVDRLKCLGNAVVPQQIYPILKAIADIERLRRD